MECRYCHITIPDQSAYCCACGRKQAPSPRRRRLRDRAEGSIIKLSGRRSKPYWARLPAEYSDSKAERKSLGCFASYHEASEAIGRAIYSPQDSKPTMTLEDLYDQFLGSHYYAALGKSAQGSHKSAWGHLHRCSSTLVGDINKATFQAPIDRMYQQGLKRETLAKVRNLASLLCQEAMGLGLMTVNYGRLIQLPRADTAAVIPFSSDELITIWDAADGGSTDAMTVLLLCYTGMRPSELLDARIEEHLHMDDNHWYLRTGSKTEAGYDRVIPLPKLIRPILTHLLSGRECGPIIAAPKGGHYRLDNWRPRRFNTLMAQLDLEGHVPYSCRHTYADLQKRREVDPEIMMAIMGHEDYATAVERYQTTTSEDIARICAAADGLARPKLLDK